MVYGYRLVWDYQGQWEPHSGVVVAETFGEASNVLAEQYGENEILECTLRILSPDRVVELDEGNYLDFWKSIEENTIW